MSGKNTKSAGENRLLLVDASGYLFRAYHAVGDLRTRDGRASGAVFGTLNMLEKLRRDYPARYVACVLDAGGKNFRHDIDPAYKANRPPLPPDLKSQLAPLREFIEAFGWPLLSVPGVEADDVIAALNKDAAAADMDVVIASADKDLMQLVGGRVIMYDGMKGAVYDADAVREKFGVPPARMGDYLALVGDTSDNIPGVAKVGGKTAAKWLGQYGGLDDIIAAADEIPGVVGGNLRAAVAGGRLRLSRRLVTLRDDAPLPAALETLTPRPPDVAKWRALCERWEFRRLAAAADAMAGAPAKSDAPRYPVEMITDGAALSAWLDKIRAAGAFAVDTETIGEPVMAASLVGFSLAVEGAAAYVPLAHKDAQKQMPVEEALRLLRPLLEDEAVVKILHNGKYDRHVFANHGVVMAGVLEDTKIAAYVQNAAADNTLSALAAAHLGVKTINYKDIVDGKKIRRFDETDAAAAAAYAGEDAEVTFRLRQCLTKIFSPAGARVYRELDRPLMPVLAAMERAGVRINGDALADFARDMRARMTALEESARAIAGGDLNLQSPRQLAAVLFDDLGAKPLRKTGGGARSTDERTLERLAGDYELAAVALEHRALAKLVGTYAEKLPRAVLPRTGRVHTTFTQTAVVTGRLSSSAPNLQNIPIRTDAGRRIRRAFIPAEGCRLISADYSQIELRLAAHIAEDDALRAAFHAGADIHRQTAAEVFGMAADKVDGEHRRAAKAINFGLIYGMSSYGLARGLGITPERAQEYIDRYFERYPGIAAFMQKTRREAPARGYVETIFGRRIPLSVARGGRPALERMAINAPIQGAAADLVKSAMLSVDAALRRAGMKSRLILQVHDELVLEAPHDETDELRARLPEWMNTMPLSVPMRVDVGCGENWDEAH